MPSDAASPRRCRPRPWCRRQTGTLSQRGAYVRAPPGVGGDRRGPALGWLRWSVASSAWRTSRGHLHAPRPASPQPDEVARYLFRRVVSWGRSRTSSWPTAPASTSTSLPPRVRHPGVRLAVRPRRPRQGGERILEQLLDSAEQGWPKRGSARHLPVRTTPTRRQLLRLHETT